MEEKIASKGRRVVLAATLLSFLSGVSYTWSLISKVLIEDFNWTSKEASLPFTILTISSSISMIIFGKIQDKLGPRNLSIIGGLFLGISFILSGIILTPVMLSITIGIFLGLGIGIINISTTPVVVKWFSEDIKGKITGIVVGGVGISSIFYSPLINKLLGTIGLNKSFIYIGIFILIFSTLLSFFISNPPINFDPDKGIKRGGAIKSNRDLNWKEMLKTLDFYKLWLMFAFNSAVGLMLITHISNISKVQAGWEGGFILIIIVAIFNALGRLLGGSLSDKLDRINFLRIIFALQAINITLFAMYNSILPLILGVAVGGFCYGSGFSVFPSALSDYYGLKNFSENYGLLFTAWSLGGIIGPMTSATVFDAYSNYKLAYIIGLGLIAVSMLLTFTMKPKKKY